MIRSNFIRVIVLLLLILPGIMAGQQVVRGIVYIPTSPYTHSGEIVNTQSPQYSRVVGVSESMRGLYPYGSRVKVTVLGYPQLSGIYSVEDKVPGKDLLVGIMVDKTTYRRLKYKRLEIKLLKI